MADWHRKDLLGLEDLSAAEIETILSGAAAAKRDFVEGRRLGDLRGRTLAFIFSEPSTRTRSSFEVAARRLDAEVLSFSVAQSSVLKGESLTDTLLNLQAMGVDVFVIRHELSGAPHQVAASVGAHIINAGDGAHEHPTQALLDLFTLKERKGRVEGLKVVILGDILHSRVARSNIWGLRKLKAKVTVCGPATLVPAGLAGLGVAVSHDLRQALQGADAVNVLRLQLERQKENLFPSLGEYYDAYGLTPEKLALAKPDCVVLHPGPMNRGVEIASETADGPQSAILEQVTNGVAVRMAVLRLLAGRKKARPEPMLLAGNSRGATGEVAA
ncbi:MAG: aspartate carbamoyltransferase catalytic subunit [Elusimicrobia bacterium]|nr:aspartate carbamoyltransferase catalytic subunit [Elusimicrobiota bacterium]